MTAFRKILTFDTLDSDADFATAVCPQINLSPGSAGLFAAVDEDGAFWINDQKIGPSVIPPAPSNTFTLIAGENISNHHAVVCIGGLAYNADASTIGHVGRVVGVSITSALMGASITVQADDETDNAGFAFTPGDPVFLGNAGALVQTITGTAFEQQMGVALSISRLLISMDEEIIYA